MLGSLGVGSVGLGLLKIVKSHAGGLRNLLGDFIVWGLTTFAGWTAAPDLNPGCPKKQLQNAGPR